MYFIKVEEKLYSSTGKFAGVTLEITPIFGNNNEFSVALYREIWHRIRRDLWLKSEVFFKRTTRSDPGSIYFCGAESPGSNRMATILFNNAETTRHCPDYANAEQNARKTLRYMDKLVRTLVLDSKYSLALTRIAQNINIESGRTSTELKTLLKIFCRGQGMFVDEADVSYAIVQAKNRRRKKYLATHPEHSPK